MSRTLIASIAIALVCAPLSGCDPYERSGWSSGSGSSAGSEQSAENDDEDGDTDEGAPITDADRARGQSVRVLESLGGQRAEVVGLVDVHETPGNEPQGLTDLRARAAMLGAEGLTGVEVHPPAPGENITHFSGIAVRFNDLLHGRPYDVLGEIDVDASMLHEDEAYAELRRRARQMHADLLLDVRFDHGDGTSPLHLRAEAIRIRQ